MSHQANNAIITKCKAIYGNFLKPADYEKIIKLNTVPDLVAFLKKQPNYVEILKDVQENNVHRGQLEALIRKNLFNRVMRLLKLVYSKDVSFFELNIVSQENELILSILRVLISEEQEELKGKLPYFFDVHTKIDMTKLMKTTTFDDLLDAVKNSPYYEILKPFNVKDPEMIRYLDIEFALESYYYKEAFDRIEKNYNGTLKKQLESIFKTRIELSNIIKIYRLKKFYKADPITIKNVLIKEKTRIPEAKLDEIIQISNPDAILKYLAKEDFSSYKDADDYVYVEYFAGKIQYQLARKFMYFGSDVPLVYIAFVTLSQIEVENLTNIIEGIRYDLDESEIKQMLIY